MNKYLYARKVVYQRKNMQNSIYKPNNWGGQTIVEQKSSKNYCRYFIALKFFFKGTVTRKTTIFLQNQNINIIFKKKNNRWENRETWFDNKGKTTQTFWQTKSICYIKNWRFINFNLNWWVNENKRLFISLAQILFHLLTV